MDTDGRTGGDDDVSPNATNSDTSADGAAMRANRRTIAAIVAGVASLVSAVAAIATAESAPVLVAVALALVSVLLVLSTTPSRRGRHPDATVSSSASSTGDAPAPGATPLASSAPVDLTDGATGSGRSEASLHEDDLPPGVIDPATGLFNQLFFDASLVKRVSAARRSLRPLSVAIADIGPRSAEPGAEPVPAPAADVGRVMVHVFREADLLARADDGRYLILLEDTPENGAVWTLERLRRRLSTELPGDTLWVGVSCYPAYGFAAPQLIAQARRALAAAQEWQQDRIEVTAESPED